MRRIRRSLVLTVAAATTGLVAGGSATADEHLGDDAFHVAVIGDAPYGEAAIAAFPDLVEMINDDDEGADFAVHVGDIKGGKTTCTDEKMHVVRTAFDDFEMPLFFTPGDNEWTDCHRDNNGSYDPNERLRKIRRIFFSPPGWSLGEDRIRVDAQHRRGYRYPENQRWSHEGVVFATIHAVGSDNNFLPGTCYPAGTASCPTGSEPETAQQAARRVHEASQRSAANLVWLAEAFAEAEATSAPGVALFIHADMKPKNGPIWAGHATFVEALDRHAQAFGLPVILVSGDTHDFRVDAPADWMASYVATPATNVTQVIVDRSIEAEDTVWLRLTVDPDSDEVFSWQEVFGPGTA